MHVDFSENSWLNGTKERSQKNMDFNKLYTIMQKWTPLSVSASLIVLMSVVVIAILTFRNEPIPQWAVETLTIFGTLLGATGLISHGANIGSNSATNAASETAKSITENLPVTSQENNVHEAS